MNIPHKKINDFSLPAIGLGTWGMGGFYTRDPSNDDDQDVRAIRAAYDMGIRHFDTAELYAEGHTERLIAKALGDVPRESVILTSKVHPNHLHHDDVIEAAKRSLERLETSYLDLYLIHGPNPDIPVRETMRAMEYLLEHGFIRHMGVSNFHYTQIDEARTYTSYPIVTNQIHYALDAREYEDNGTLEYCEDQGILVTAYRPLSKGGLPHSQEAILLRLAEKYGKTPAQIALNWVIRKPHVVTLVKTSHPEHLREDIGAIGWVMDPEDVRLLDEEFPRGEVAHGPRQ